MTCKCAFIRSNRGGENQCPFGLDIPVSCKYAGDSIKNMAPLEIVKESEHNQVKKTNKRIYLYTRTDTKCSFAAEILDNFDAVDCNYGDTAEGVGMPNALVGSPLYPQNFSGIGLDGLYAFPMGYYADNNASRNLFTGLFSLVGEVAPIIVKNALENKAPNIWEKIENGDILLPDEQKKMNEILREIRDFFSGK